MKKGKKIKKQFCFYFSIKHSIKYLLVIIFLGVFLLPKNILAAANLKTTTIIELTNQERIKAGLPPLNYNETLTKAAISKAKDILEKQKFEHNIDEKKFSEWIKEAGYQYSYVGENLAIDFITERGVVNAWLESASHRKNIMNPYFQEIGVASLSGIFEGKETNLIVQIFGLQSNIINSNKLETDNINTETKNQSFKNQTLISNSTNYNSKIKTTFILKILPILKIDEKTTNYIIQRHYFNLLKIFQFFSFFFFILSIFFFYILGIIYAIQEIFNKKLSFKKHLWNIKL